MVTASGSSCCRKDTEHSFREVPRNPGGLYICTMRYFILFIFICLAGCSPRKKKGIRDEITGNWFIVYPDEKLNRQEERMAYGLAQDSLVNLKGVKLVTFKDNGTFIQWDSTGQSGKWGVSEEDRKVVVKDGGRGFVNFKTTYISKEEGEMILSEKLMLDGEEVLLEWHLKRISGGKFARLFEPDENTWRRPPAGPETEAQMRKRLATMLSYYADYFRLISEESSYFVPSRVMLPVRFYQHAIGMNEFEPTHRFVSMFRSETDAKKAYDLLKDVINSATFDLPDDEKAESSFSYEYALMLDILAKDMLK